MVDTIPPGTLRGTRDRALVLLGFGGAFRREELMSLNVADLEFVTDGLRVTIRHSKTDQESIGQTIAVARGTTCCPIAAVQEWLAATQITEGPVFRAIGKDNKVASERLTPKSANVILKQCATRAGLDPKTLSMHSLRAGFLTSAARAGADIFKMRDVSRHKSLDVLQTYVRDADLFRRHAGEGLL
jgi:site-specific recombinase XerD